MRVDKAMLSKRIIGIVLGIILIVGFIVMRSNNSMDPSKPPSFAKLEIRFVPIGDSYTIGQGVDPKESWPAMFVEHLHGARVSIELIVNPSRTGWTTKDAIERELPIFEASHPTFSTILIGVNDWVQGVDAATFRQRLGVLMDRMIKVLGSSDKMLAISIPDFSVTPTGKRFGYPKKNFEGIQKFNTIIKEESAKRGIVVVDIFELSQEMGRDPTLVASDGLHPSAEEYRRWEGKIFTEAIKLLPHPQP